MEDQIIMLGVLSSTVIGINLYVIKSLSDLCKRISRLEGFLNKHDWPFKLGCLISHLWLSLMETELIGLVGVLIIGMSVILKVGTHASGR